MKKVYLSLLTVFLFFLTACGSQNTNTSQDNWKTYSNNELGIEFSYPGSWTSVDPKTSGMQNPPTALIYTDAGDKEFADNLNLYVQQTPFLAQSAEEQANSVVSMFQTSPQIFGFKDYQKLSFTPKKLGNIQAGTLLSEYTMSQNGIRVKAAQFIVPYGQKTFTLSFTCKVNKWNSYKPTFDKIVDSFKIKQQ